ncbi:MAG TPA: twin-arginine translocase TatA/TatE family subunit [Solirubrobacteraceae bacterium]|jgi:sec-independent protein translocase protein TatA
MGLSNPLHIAFLLVIMLLVFGAKRLPEMGKSLGEGLRGFKGAIDGEPTPSEIATHTTAVPVQATAMPTQAMPMPTQVTAAPAQEPEVVQPAAETVPAPLVHS